MMTGMVSSGLQNAPLFRLPQPRLLWAPQIVFEMKLVERRLLRKPWSAFLQDQLTLGAVFRAGGNAAGEGSADSLNLIIFPVVRDDRKTCRT